MRTLDTPARYDRIAATKSKRWIVAKSKQAVAGGRHAQSTPIFVENLYRSSVSSGTMLGDGTDGWIKIAIHLIFASNSPARAASSCKLAAWLCG
jgi:hypothetical protein